MNKGFSSWLEERSTGKLTIAGLVLFVLFSIVFLPVQSQQVEAYSQGMGSPDTSLFYTPADLYEMANVYGEEGRIAYINARFSFDIAFPIIYAFFLTNAIGWFSKRVLAQQSSLHSGNVLPLYAFVFDILENISTSMVFKNFPQQSRFWASLAPFCTLVKWIYVCASFALLLGLVIAYIIQRIKKPAEPDEPAE